LTSITTLRSGASSRASTSKACSTSIPFARLSAATRGQAEGALGGGSVLIEILADGAPVTIVDAQLFGLRGAAWISTGIHDDHRQVGQFLAFGEGTDNGEDARDALHDEMADAAFVRVAGLGHVHQLLGGAWRAGSGDVDQHGVKQTGQLDVQ
jgi:hypothetical protein